jgi:Response regulator receiver domain
MDYRPHIVVVEDEATQRRLLVDYLVRQNFRVSGADGGTALRKLVEREMPALVLLDVGLPGKTDSLWLDGCARKVHASALSWSRPPLKPWTAWLDSKLVRTTTSQSRSSRASCWRG